MVTLIRSHSEKTMKKNAFRDAMMNGTGTEIVTRVGVHLGPGAAVQGIEVADLQKEEIADSLKQTDQN